MRDATTDYKNYAEVDKISIHASHAGCDLQVILPITLIIDFNPRIPCGMRQGCCSAAFLNLISIHASHAGCDFQYQLCT